MVQFFTIALGTYAFLTLLGFGVWRIWAFHNSVNKNLIGSLPALIGAAVLLTIGSILFPRGFSNKEVIFVLLIIALISFMLSLCLRRSEPEKIPIRTRDLFDHPIALVMYLIVIVDTFLRASIGTVAVWGTRLGIDGALYIDAAQALIQNENSPNFANIEQQHPAGLASAVFNLNRRWGVPFLLSICKTITNSSHALDVAIPVVSLMLILLTTFSFYVVKEFSRSNPVRFMVIPFILFNTYWFHLLMEAQWANIVGISLLIPLLYIFVKNVLDKSQSKIGWLAITSTSTIFAFLLIGILISYSEILPLIISTLITSFFVKLIMSRKSGGGLLDFRSLVLMWPILILLLIPNFDTLIPYFLTLFNVKAESVGYPLPHPLFPSDLLGLSNPWHPVSAWNEPGVSVKFVSNSRDIVATLASIALMMTCLKILFLRDPIANVKELSKKRFKKDLNTQSLNGWPKVLFVTSLLGLSVSYFYFSYIKKSNYLVSKSASVFIVPLVVMALVLVVQIKRKYSRYLITFLVLISLQIFYTVSIYAMDFRSTSRQITEDFIHLEEWDKSTPREFCVVSFGPRGKENANFRYFDRTFDYVRAAVLRNHIVIDPWTNSSLIGAVDPEVFESSNICVVINRITEKSAYAQLKSANKAVIFTSGAWLIFDLQSKISEHTQNVAFEEWQNKNFFLARGGNGV